MFKHSMTEKNNQITARQTRTGLTRQNLAKNCSIEYFTTEIELVLPNFQVLDPSQNYRIFNVRTIV